MAEVQWIKFYIDMFDKRKINKIRRLPEGDKILLFWVMLLAMAGKCNAGGMIYITERVPFTKEDLADEFEFEISMIELALKAFEELDMIDVFDDGFISVRNWEKYQSADKLAEMREKNRLSQQKSRAKKKLLQGVNDLSYDSHVTSHECHSVEEEGEKEGEKEEEKELHSFIPATTDKERAKMNFLGGSLGKGVVLLSDEQMDDLLDKLSLDEFNKYVAIVAECELNGQKFKKKTHYQAILDMVAKDRKTKEK